MNDLIHLKIAFIGGGNMAKAIFSGLITQNFPKNHLIIAEPDESTRQKITTEFQLQTTANNLAAIQTADLVILAVKPQIMPLVLNEIATTINTQKPLIISIAAGITLKSLEAKLSSSLAVVRCMPNTPALINAGISALIANSQVSQKMKEIVEQLFSAIGNTIWIENEAQMDIVTALSGSGPAYFFLFIEQLIEAAVKEGLPKKIATTLALQTALGSSKMATQSQNDLSQLREQVTSKGGTTEAALNILQHSAFIDIIHQALKAAKLRSEELSHFSIDS